MEKTSGIKDKILGKKIAKGILYAWASIITADGSYKEQENEGLYLLAEQNDYIKEFYDRESMKGVFSEVIEILKLYGIDELYNRVGFILREIDANSKSHIFFACLHLACIDRELANREILLLQKLYHAMKLDIDTVFKLTMLFFQSEYAKKGKGN